MIHRIKKAYFPCASSSGGNPPARRFAFGVMLFLSLIPNSIDAELLWPVDRPRRITGTFCEPRGLRFHAGIDVSCAGLKGFTVSSAEDGYVSSVMYQKWGIGYAVFVTHPDGRKSFYGHLDRFSEGILKHPKIKSAGSDILDRRDFRIELKDTEIPVKRGAALGYSGDSGIGREHFHFELRDRENANLNPLRYGISVPDTSAPVIKEVFLVPLDEFSHVNGNPAGAAFPVRPCTTGRGLYEIADTSIPEIGGRVGVRLRAYDTSGYSRKVAVYGLELSLNGTKAYSHEFDRFPRDGNHLMGLYYDTDNSNSSVYTHYVYSRRTQDGWIDSRKFTSPINVEVIACDAAMNRSCLTLRLKAGNPAVKPYYSYKPNLLPGKKLELKSADRQCRIRFKKNSALYGEMVGLSEAAAIRPVMAGLALKSGMYTTAPSGLCLDEPAEILLRYEGDDFRKVGIYFMNHQKNRFSFIGNSYSEKEKAFRTETMRMGGFFLLRDDIPPKIRYKAIRNVRKGHVFRFFISDIGTGVDLNGVDLNVDGRSVIWDYDPDHRCIEILPHNEIWRQGGHVITLKIRDLAGNISNTASCPYSIRS